MRAESRSLALAILSETLRASVSVLAEQGSRDAPPPDGVVKCRYCVDAQCGGCLFEIGANENKKKLPNLIIRSERQP